MSECNDVPVIVIMRAPSVRHGSDLDIALVSVFGAWQREIKEIIENASWMGTRSVEFSAVHDNNVDGIEFKGVIKRSEIIPVIKTVSKIFNEIGIVQVKMEIKIYDPCKCQRGDVSE
jgi:hypothetical protein